MYLLSNDLLVIIVSQMIMPNMKLIVLYSVNVSFPILIIFALLLVALLQLPQRNQTLKQD